MQGEQKEHKFRTYFPEFLPVHSHSRSQTSVFLNSMEAEILAATCLLTEAIYLKQVVQFLVNDTGGLATRRR